MPKETVKVGLLRGYNLYLKGEILDVSETEATALCAAKIAVPYVPPAKLPDAETLAEEHAKAAHKPSAEKAADKAVSGAASDAAGEPDTNTSGGEGEPSGD